MHFAKVRKCKRRGNGNLAKLFNLAKRSSLSLSLSLSLSPLPPPPPPLSLSLSLFPMSSSSVEGDQRQVLQRALSIGCHQQDTVLVYPLILLLERSFFFFFFFSRAPFQVNKKNRIAVWKACRNSAQLRLRRKSGERKKGSGRCFQLNSCCVPFQSMVFFFFHVAGCFSFLKALFVFGKYKRVWNSQEYSGVWLPFHRELVMECDRWLLLLLLLLLLCWFASYSHSSGFP